VCGGSKHAIPISILEKNSPNNNESIYEYVQSFLPIQSALAN
jgi:hypothetical protein